MFSQDSCFEVGHITKPHGLAGEVVIFLDVDDPSQYEEVESFFLEIKGELIPYFIETFLLLEGKGKAIVKFEDVNHIDKAKEIVGCKLFLPDNFLPELDSDSQFYYHQVIGYTIVDEDLGKLGIIANIYESAAQFLIEMQYKGKEVLIPIVDEIIGKVNHESKELSVRLPEGLLEIYE